MFLHKLSLTLGTNFESVNQQSSATNPETEGIGLISSKLDPGLCSVASTFYLLLHQSSLLL